MIEVERLSDLHPILKSIVTHSVSLPHLEEADDISLILHGYFPNLDFDQKQQCIDLLKGKTFSTVLKIVESTKEESVVDLI